jgi:hypothetical protein
MPYTFIAELPEIQVRDGIFFVEVGERCLTFTPHMFLATLQKAAKAYSDWEGDDRQVVQMQAGVRGRH